MFSLRGRGGVRIAALATVVASVAGAGAVAAAPGGGTPAVAPGFMPRGPVNTCFWRDPQINPGPIDQLHQEDNFAGPDTDTAYYYTRFQLPPGATVVLKGEYPHARFMSYTTYKTIDGVSGFPAAALYDTQIRPDRGSVNPFKPGASRDAVKRAYTVTISGQVPPANLARNTLYVGQAGMTGQSQLVEMILASIVRIVGTTVRAGCRCRTRPIGRHTRPRIPGAPRAPTSTTSRAKPSWRRPSAQKRG